MGWKVGWDVEMNEWMWEDGEGEVDGHLEVTHEDFPEPFVYFQLWWYHCMFRACAHIMIFVP